MNLLIMQGDRDSVVGIATRWTVRGSNTRGGRRFSLLHTSPERPYGVSRLLYNEHRSPFPGVKRPGCGVDHSPPSSAEV
jgi:hypothetical protein